MVGIALATTSSYTSMVCSMWGSATRRMDRDGGEALGIIQMALSGNMTDDQLLQINKEYK